MNAPENGFRAGLSERVIAVALTPEEKRRQRARSLAIAWSLGALVLIFFAVTMVRMGGDASMPASAKLGPSKIDVQTNVVQRSI